MAFQTIDELVVEIKTKSANAAQDITTLAESLAELKRATRGGAGLTTITNQFTKFSAAIKSMSSPALKIAGLVSALKPLETIGKSNLGSALNQLKKIPEITKGLDNQKLSDFAAKIQQVTIAVKPLATEMEKVSLGFSKLPSNIQKAINANARLTKSNARTAFGFNMMIAKLGVYVYALRRIGRVIAGWIKESNDYVENLNLFTASMGQYAAAAQKYAEHVGDIMGIDPSDWMRAQGIFNTLIVGFGVGAEKAALMSKNLTQLSYDLSSFYNISVEDAMQKVQSGISGELEPLRRLGYDLSQAKLQAIALENGITKAFTAMTQAEKSQLRYYAALTQVTVAQGDMARTLEAPANQLRILKAQAVQAGRALGNIFIPALNAILPYAIAFLKVVRWVADELASLFGFSLPEIDYSGIDYVAGGAEEMADGFDGATSAAKELRKTIMGFDQLNLMNAPTSSGGGTGDVGGGGGDLNLDLPEYDFLGGLVETKTAAIFDKWKKDAEPFVNFLVNNFDRIKTTAIAIGLIILSWKVGSGLTSFITKLGKTPLLFTGGFLAGVGGAGLALSIQDIITEGLNNINFATILGSAGAFTGGAALIGKAFGSKLIGSSVGGLIAGAGLLFAGLYDAIKNGIDWLSAALIPIGSTAMGASIGAIIGSLGGPIGTGIGALIGLAVGLLTDLTIWIVQNWGEIKEGAKKAIAWVKNSFVVPIVGFFGGLVSGIKEKVEPIKEWFEILFSNTWMIVRAVWKVASGWFDQNVVQPIISKFNEVKSNLTTIFNGVLRIIQNIMKPISTWTYNYVVDPMVTGFMKGWRFIRAGFEVAMKGISDFAKTIFNSLLGFIEGMINKAIGALNKLVIAFNKASRWSSDVLGVSYKELPTINEVSIRKMASGGFVPSGQMFIAREAGAEMVGNIGGRTAVANNDQIVEAVASGVAQAVRGSMGDGGDINIYVDGVLTKSVSAIERKNTRAGRTVIPVGV